MSTTEEQIQDLTSEVSDLEERVDKLERALVALGKHLGYTIDLEGDE